MRYLRHPYHLGLTFIPTHWVCDTQPQDVFTEKATVGFSETCVTHCEVSLHCRVFDTVASVRMEKAIRKSLLPLSVYSACVGLIVVLTRPACSFIGCICDHLNVNYNVPGTMVEPCFLLVKQGAPTL